MQLLCEKSDIKKLLFKRNTFYGNTTGPGKKQAQNIFEETDIQFLFLKTKIILLTDLDQINQILLDFHCGSLAGHQIKKVVTTNGWE